MVLVRSMKAVPLVLILAACGGGGGEPGVAPQAGNGAETRLHPETYIERWWPDCNERVPCTPGR